MRKYVKHVASLLIALAMLICIVPMTAAAETGTATPSAETIDLDDTSVVDIVGEGTVVEEVTEGTSTYYKFYGGGKDIYNKVATKKTYSGNYTLSYDIQFTSDANAEMALTMVKGSAVGTTEGKFANAIGTNFVLHTNTSGMRLYVTDANAANTRTQSESGMATTYADQKTGVWYTVEVELTDSGYTAKYWPAGDTEPETPQCTVAAAAGDPTEGYIGFCKRGSGYIMLRNVQVTYGGSEDGGESGDDGSSGDETITYEHTMTLDASSTEWIHNEKGTFAAGTESGVIELGGGGSNSSYNKIFTATSFSGDMCLEFDVYFNSDASIEMMHFTPKSVNVSSDAASIIEDAAYANFVLHTASTKGIRLSYDGATVVTDTGMTTNNWTPTNTWYTVKFQVKGDTYSIKYWPVSGTEPAGWSATYDVVNAPEAGPIAFAKRGSGTLLLRDITVSYNTTVPFVAESIQQSSPISVDYGTAWSGLTLPDKVTVKGTNGAMRVVSVTWDEASYSSTKEGTQTVTGTLNLKAEENPNNIKAECEVFITPKDAVYQVSTIWEYGENSDITTYHQFGTITTKAGTILATCEARVGGGDADNPSSVVLKRSIDGGKTWGDTIVVADYAENKCSETENNCGKDIYGHFFANPTPVVDYKTGNIMIFYAENFGNASSKLYYRTSTDDGLTWSDAVELTSLFADDPYARPFHLPGPGHGLQVESGEYKGRLVVEVWHRHTVSLPSAQRQYGLSVLYSDDGGKTWANSEFIDVGFHMNEGRLAQLAGGTLVINSRSTDNTRKQTYSTDGGATWSTPVTWTSIGNYGNCDSGFTSQVTGNSTQLITTHILNNTSVRNTLYAYISYDNGKTWAYSAKLWSDASISSGTGASDVNRISANTYGAVHGTTWSQNDVEYVVFNTAYLTGLADDTSILPDYAAQVGIDNYATLGEAVAAASDGANIVIRKDIAAAETVSINKEVTIDLNGHTLWTTDIDSLCAEGYGAEYDQTTGLWKVIKDCATHSFTKYTSNNNATCTADGTETAKCDNCTATDTRTASGSKLKHTMTHTKASEASCTADGNQEYWTCSVCKKVYADEKGTTETTVADMTIKGGHKLTYTPASAGGCNGSGNVEYWYCSVCKKYYADEACTKELTDVGSGTVSHTLTYVKAKAATCTSAGNVEYWYCSACGKNFADEACTVELTNVTVNHASHAPTHVAAVAATATSDGHKEYWVCAECGRYFADAACSVVITDMSTMIIAKTPGVPKTGDTAMTTYMILLMAVSMIGLAAAGIYRKRTK